MSNRKSPWLNVIATAFVVALIGGGTALFSQGCSGFKEPVAGVVQQPVCALGAACSPEGISCTDGSGNNLVCVGGQYVDSSPCVLGGACQIEGAVCQELCDPTEGLYCKNSAWKDFSWNTPGCPPDAGVGGTAGAGGVGGTTTTTTGGAGGTAGAGGVPTGGAGGVGGTTTTTTGGAGGTAGAGGAVPPQLCYEGNTCSPDSGGKWESICVDTNDPPPPPDPDLLRCCAGVLIVSSLNDLCPVLPDGGAGGGAGAGGGTAAGGAGGAGATGGTGGAGGTTTTTTTTGTVIGSCSGALPPAGMLHVCYVADTGIGVGQYGPFELQWGSASPAYSCWDFAQTGDTCSEYGNPANLCVDSDISDSILECDVPLPSGSQEFEFTVHHAVSTEYWWSDELCGYPQGGCGTTIGTVVLTCPNGSTQAFTMQMNYLQIPDLLNGFVATVCP